MTNPLRVLIVEDSQDHAVLVLRELRRGGFDVTSQRVETAEGMRAALDAGPWDVVIADYVLPSFSAPAALKLLQEVGLDLPFLVVSGQVGEDKAVAMMRAGAHDYLMKGNLTRLVPAVQRELREAVERTKREEAEQEVRRSREFLDHLINALDDPVFAKDEEHRWVLLNDAACAVMGRPREELIGKSDYDLFPKEQADVFWEKDDQVLRSGAGNINEEQITWHGQVHTVSTKKSVFTDPATGRKLITGTIRDITERKRAEKALREERDRAQTYLDIAGVILLVLNADGSVALVNRKGCEVLGCEESEIVGKDWFDCFLPERIAKRVKAVFLDLMAGRAEAAERFENPVVTRRGDERIIAWHNAVLRDEGGIPIATLSSGEDITDRKRAEERIRLLSSMVEQSMEGMAIADLDGNLTFVNRAWAAMHDYDSADGLLGRNLSVFHTQEQLERDVVPFNRKVMEDGYHAGEVGHMRKDGRTFPTFMVTTFLRDDQGEPVGLAAVAQDITDRKRAERERERLISELKAKNAELERFAYTVSHDLQSPLITIRGFLGALAKDAAAGDAERMRDDIARIGGAAAKMQSLLRELLELSRIGRVVGRPARVPLAAVAKQAAEELAQTIAQRGARVEVAEDLPEVFGDEPRLVQMLGNLIDNAVKFSHDGPGPRVEIGARQSGGETVCFVRDDGIGIDPRYHETVFGLFHQLDPDAPGTGAGLALARRIVERHGGRMWVESEGAGRGSTFCFTLPEPGGQQPTDRHEGA